MSPIVKVYFCGCTSSTIFWKSSQNNFSKLIHGADSNKGVAVSKWQQHAPASNYFIRLERDVAFDDDTAKIFADQCGSTTSHYDWDIYKITTNRKHGPYNAGHCSGSHFFGHKSSAARAREQFKTSTDSASLLVEIGKKIFALSLGFSGGELNKWGCFCVFLATFTRPCAPIQWAIFWLTFFWKLGCDLRL